MTDKNEMETLEQRRTGLSQKSIDFLQDLLNVIEKYRLDIMVSSSGVDMFNLHDENYELVPDDFICLTKNDLQPYEKIKGSSDLSAVLKLMLNIPQLTTEEEFAQPKT